MQDDPVAGKGYRKAWYHPHDDRPDSRAENPVSDRLLW